jgi:SSS family solute:Na+ symporter
VTLLLFLLVAYSIGLILIGTWVGRAVRGTSDFFVAGKSLGPGLIFATFLAANIGASSTVGATGHAYRDGLAAWWWNGSAGLGTLILAFWLGPKIWKESVEHGLLTVGDFREHHFGRGVRGLAALMVWAGSFFILCGQLKGAAVVLNAAAGWSLGTGAFVSALFTVSYFVLGGLKSAAIVNQVQLVVILVGFLIAGPMAASNAGGLFVSGTESSFWSGSQVGWYSLLLLAPAFFLSPGLLQKALGARDKSSLIRGVAISGVVLMIFAWLPVLIGMAARVLHPDLTEVESALPVVLKESVPFGVGSLALAAVFSAEISSADAVLFMLATSGARDFYRGFLKPSASDAEVLRVARLLACVGGLVGFGLTFFFSSVVSAITVFYQLMIVTLFAPMLGALLLPRAGRWSALTSMLIGVGTFITTWLATDGAGLGVAAPPHFLGLVASALTFFILAAF